VFPYFIWAGDINGIIEAEALLQVTKSSCLISKQASSTYREVSPLTGPFQGHAHKNTVRYVVGDLCFNECFSPF
jgi:hypothetical protein